MQAQTIGPKPKNKTNLIQGSKYLWRYEDADEQIINAISTTHQLSKPIAHALYSRGITDPEKIRNYLFSSFEHDVPHGSLLKDAKKATERILQAIEHQEKILIFGDYDVDGVTSSSIMLLGLIPLGARINFFLPNRRRDGYGLSSKFVKKAFENDFKLIITVDNGITAYEAADDAKKLGIDLIITDHHRAHDSVPDAFAIVNPNQDDCSYPYKHLAGVGVAFKLINLIYEEKKLPLPDKVYELLMLGTIADVVPLVGENRFWVRHGLSKINKLKSTAVATMMHNGKLPEDHILNSLDIGFMIAPQINALGRLDDCREAVKFLISSDQEEVSRIGHVLKHMNETRKKVDQKIYQEIEGAIISKEINLEKNNIILAGNHSWPTGVIGLVAGKLMNNYGKPTFLFHLDTKSGIAKGSCRSIPEFDIFNALSESKDLLISFGGHACAAGLAIKQKDLPLLKQRLEAKIARELSPIDLMPKITIDALLDLHDANKKLITDMQQLEPFGNANPQPAFLIQDVTLLKQPTLLKDKHLKCSLFSDGAIKQVIFFNRADLYPLLLEIDDKPFDIAGYVVKNEWQGKMSIELQGIDILFK